MKNLLIIILIFATKTTGNNTHMQTEARPLIRYNNAFEQKYALDNGVYCGVEYTGDMIHDWGVFVLGQGGKSDCVKDLSTKYRPKVPDVDGRYYHTVKDVTWRTFRGLAKKYGYDSSPYSFYNMDDDVHRLIINHFMEKSAVTESDVINAFLSFVLWGSGSLKMYLEMFDDDYGDINEYIQEHGEYEALHSCILIRHQHLQHSRTWDVHGKGWSSGLAHYHRIFKHYCNN
jgi:hypothetical protein